MTKRGGCVVAENGARIPKQTLDDLCEIIAAQHALVIEKWKVFFRTDTVLFYC